MAERFGRGDAAGRVAAGRLAPALPRPELRGAVLVVERDAGWADFNSFTSALYRSSARFRVRRISLDRMRNGLLLPPVKQSAGGHGRYLLNLIDNVPYRLTVCQTEVAIATE